MRDAYCDRQLTTKLKLSVEIFCTEIFPYENSEIIPVCRNHACLSVSQEIKSPLISQYQSYSSKIDEWKGLHEYFNLETPKNDILFKKVGMNFDLHFNLC